MKRFLSWIFKVFLVLGSAHYFGCNGGGVFRLGNIE